LLSSIILFFILSIESPPLLSIWTSAYIVVASIPLKISFHSFLSQTGGFSFTNLFI